jgi:hypothetical protein
VNADTAEVMTAWGTLVVGGGVIWTVSQNVVGLRRQARLASQEQANLVAVTEPEVIGDPEFLPRNPTVSPHEGSYKYRFKGGSAKNGSGEAITNVTLKIRISPRIGTKVQAVIPPTDLHEGAADEPALRPGVTLPMPSKLVALSFEAFSTTTMHEPRPLRIETEVTFTDRHRATWKRDPLGRLAIASTPKSFRLTKWCKSTAKWLRRNRLSLTLGVILLAFGFGLGLLF